MSDEWRMASGEWRVASGHLEKNREWRMENGEWSSEKVFFILEFIHSCLSSIVKNRVDKTRFPFFQTTV